MSTKPANILTRHSCIASLALLVTVSCFAQPEGSNQFGPPTSAFAITQAVDGVGLLKMSEFETKWLSESDLESMRASVQKQQWISQIDGLEDKILSGLPVLAGQHETGFLIWIYFSEAFVEALSINAPIVNGSGNQVQQMLDSMAAAGSTLVEDFPDARAWIETESWYSCKLWRDLSKRGGEGERNDLIRKKQFGDYLLTVWCVPPDLIVFNAVHRSRYKYETETVSWSEAKARAEEQGGHLATFSTVEELSYVKSQLPPNSIFWVGLTDQEEEGSWTWVDGSQLDVSMMGSLELGQNSQRRDYAHITLQGILGSRNDSGALPQGFRGKRRVDGYIIEFD